MMSKDFTSNDKMYVFKVKDYTTLLVGRYNAKEEVFYIQRGDGLIVNKYESYRITFRRELTYADKIKTL